METTNGLRRGNLIKVYNEIYQVFSITDCFVGFSEVGKDELLGDTDVKNVEPLDITDGLLFNSGFKSQEAAITIDLDTVFQLSKNKGEAFLRLETIKSGITIPIHTISFIHNLQNFYSSFTGKELEIKL